MIPDLKFYKDEKGRIIKAIRGDNYATIEWANEDADIDFCNFVVTIVITARGVGKNV
jgi:hypothetical protein